MLREINKESNMTEIQKSQFLRVVDVLILGPLLIYASKKTKEKYLNSALFISGILVIANNATNFYKNIKK